MAQDTRYRPPTKVVTVELPYQSLVTKADDYWARGKFHEIEYVWSNGRTMFANPYVRGPYAPPSN